MAIKNVCTVWYCPQFGPPVIFSFVIDCNCNLLIALKISRVVISCSHLQSMVNYRASMYFLDKMPYGARCTFENDDWCGWKNLPEADMHWRLHKGSTPLNFTGPNFDHTYLNSTGSYLYVNMLHDPSFFGSQAILRSVTFNAPPGVTGDPSSRYYNTCAVSSI